MKKLKAILRIVTLALLGIFLGVRVYLWNAQSLVGDSMPMPFGYGAAVVLSGSMEPTFSAGDLIVVQQDSSLEKDDIVVFEDIGSLVVHRIIEIDGENVITKGDANNTDDGPVALSKVRGRVLFHIPGMGTVVQFLKTPVGTLCMILAAVALIEIPWRQEKRRDEEERQKLIDEIRRLKDEQTEK